MRINEITQPQNVVEPEDPQDQQPEVQADQTPAEPTRKPRFKWQAGPAAQDYGSPATHIKNPETGKLETNPEWAEWYKTDKATELNAARTAHYQAQAAAMQQHAGVSEKDFDTTIDEFPNPYFRAGGTDDEEDPNYEPEVISIGVDYEYSYNGKYYAATMIDPAEYPDLEISISRVIDLDNGEDITKKVDLGEIEQYIEDEIPGWEQSEQDARDDAAIDRYEANRDDYYESINRIKNLSGL